MMTNTSEDGSKDENKDTSVSHNICYQYWVYLQLCFSMCIGTLKANNNPFKASLLECIDRVFLINNTHPMSHDVTNCTTIDTKVTFPYIMKLILAIAVPDVIYWIKNGLVRVCTQPLHLSYKNMVMCLYSTSGCQLWRRFYIRYMHFKKVHVDSDSDSEAECDDNLENHVASKDQYQPSPFIEQGQEFEEDHFENIEDSDELYTIYNYRRINTHSRLFLNRMESAIQRTILEMDSHV